VYFRSPLGPPVYSSIAVRFAEICITFLWSFDCMARGAHRQLNKRSDAVPIAGSAGGVRQDRGSLARTTRWRASSAAGGRPEARHPDKFGIEFHGQPDRHCGTKRLEQKLTARRNSSRKPRYRRLTNIEATRQVGLAGATVGERIQGLALLMSGQLWRSTHMNPTRFGASSTFPGSGPYQITFKLGEAAKNREHQSAMRRGRVCPNVGQ
jgi:hypothetical protein